MTGSYILQPCEGNSAYEAIPKEELNFDLPECGGILEEEGFEILDAHVLLIASKEELETTIYPSGRLLVKTDAKEIAAPQVALIYGLLEKH